mmetsp:Transcript_32503/g.103017  ORF Transcript_32503/g.103017 Transcript_32503/m.103017 type:complete len:94 (-) Transcript_32503:8-289(-)
MPSEHSSEILSRNLMTMPKQCMLFLFLVVFPCISAQPGPLGANLPPIEPSFALSASGWPDFSTVDVGVFRDLFMHVSPWYYSRGAAPGLPPPS